MAVLSIALALLAAAAPAADSGQADVNRAAALIGAKQPAEAVAVLDALIARQEAERKGETRDVYCARTPAETMLYTGMAAQAKRRALVLAEAACYPLFLKGFALIDLNRPDEARPWLERALAMGPSNAQFLGELAEWYKSQRQWPKARELFQRAVDASALSPENRQVFDKTRGLRGLGFILVEEHRLDEAEKLYREALRLDPNDERSKRQLQYIAEQRGTTI